ncbi:MAG: hypothetical protein K2K04_04000 [Clostridia bacterium]|nr:hypothetical protein [Clostridia bacterium]
MAVDTPVLERITVDEERKYSVPSRLEILAEEEHNARIKDNYARLINPEYKIEDVFNRAEEKASAPVAEPVMQSAPAQVRRSITGGHPYKVENARADAAIFRADSAINAQRAQVAEVNTVAAVAPAEEENEDLRPTPTTIQYQTIGVKNEENTTAATTKKHGFVLGKREKIIIAVFVAVVVALITVVLINASIISNLNAEISSVQESITTVKGAIAGVNSTVSGIVEDIMSSGINN